MNHQDALFDRRVIDDAPLPGAIGPESGLEKADYA